MFPPLAAIVPTVAAEDEAPRSPDVRPPTPGNTLPAPAVEPSFDQGIHKIDLPARETPPVRPALPVDQLRDAPARIPKSLEQPLPDPCIPLSKDAPTSAELPAAFTTLSSLANVPAQQWDAFRVLAEEGLSPSEVEFYSQGG